MATWDVSQLNLLQKKSIEQIKSISAVHSARGKYHRSLDHFHREVHNNSAIISVSNQARRREGKIGTKPSALYFPYLQRAIAYERLHEIDKAIADYTICINIDSNYATAYFNRSGLYNAQGDTEKAIEDMKMAIKLDPSNESFRSNYALLLRDKGQYLEAIQETMMYRAIQKYPSIVKDLKSGKDIVLDSDSLTQHIPEDDLIVAMRLPKAERNIHNMVPVVDFLKQLKFFSSLAKDADVMSQIACSIDIKICNKDTFLFQEGDTGSHFFMIVDGEISIVKVTKDDHDVIVNMLTFVKLFRGQSFGETALDSRGGKRTAGAYVSRMATLLMLERDDYQKIMMSYQSVLNGEVESALKNCPVFNGWEKKRLNHISSLFTKLNYSPHSVIIKAGEPVTSLFLIRRGIVKVIKAISKPKLDNLSFKTQQNCLWSLQRNWRGNLKAEERSVDCELVDFTVGLLGSGQVFGELAVLDPSVVSPVSIVSYAAVELYAVESDVIIALGARFNTATMNALNESHNFNNPLGAKFDYYFKEKYQWEVAKRKVLGSLPG